MPYLMVLKKKTGLVNFNKVLKIAKEAKPKMIICGGSAYPRFVEFEKYKEIANGSRCIFNG